MKNVSVETREIRSEVGIVLKHSLIGKRKETRSPQQFICRWGFGLKSNAQADDRWVPPHGLGMLMISLYLLIPQKSHG